jgi:hypothetical protein
MKPYPIFILDFDSPDVIEQLGSKPKFWFRKQDDDQPWLFKYTRVNTGEDWSEKIASEVAHLLEIPAAVVELAMFRGKRGSASRSFVEKDKGFGLIHGSEVLAGRVLGYEKTKQWHQSNHSIKNIISAVELTFTPRQRRQQLRTLAGFIVLDAIICNTDRHHDNWGLLRGPFGRGKARHQVAPSFDHASSLGRELGDERRKAIMLDLNGIERYVMRGRGGIFWDDRDTKGENPLLLAIKAAKTYPKYFYPWIQKLGEVNPKDISGIVERIPVQYINRVCLLMPH